MEKAKEKCYTHSKQEENISKWCEAFLTDKKDIFKEKVGEMNMSKKTKEKLVRIVGELSEDEECIGLYTELTDRELIYNTMIEDAENEGLKKGMEKGSKENSILIAKNMLQKGMDIDLIIELTNLTKDEIEKLYN